MNRTFDISDETYEILKSLAAERGQEPEDLLEQWLGQVREQAAAQHSVATGNGQPIVYDAAIDPLASYLGVFEATAPNVVREHDAFVGEA